MAIAFFYAVGTAIGGITGPLLFGRVIESGDRGAVAMSFLIAAAVMAVGGIVELIFGVKAEGQNLENLAAPPLTSADQETTEEDSERVARDARIAARAERQRADQTGRRRKRPGPAPGGDAAWREPPTPGAAETALDHEIQTIARAVAEFDELSVRELHKAVGARYWGPGEFRKAVREALAENRIARKRRGRIGLPEKIGVSRS